MTRYVRIAFFFFLALFILSYLKKNALPAAADILPDMRQAPNQTPIEHGPIIIHKEGKRYTISPLYGYSLRGLVVSSHDSASWLDFSHARWGDKLNVRDLCVLWGDNVADALYDKFSFSSGDFTCFIHTDDSNAWRAFKEDQISNNHLLAGSEEIARAIAHAEPGDQIAFKGFLATYAHEGGFSRGTSTTRLDKGNGACETVFVTHFKLLHKGNKVWHGLYRLSGWGVAVALCTLVALFLYSLRGGDRHADSWYRQGVRLAAKGKFRHAEKALTRALDMDPEMMEGYRDRALVRSRLGLEELAAQDKASAERLAARLKAYVDG